jgi:hypothetical protein
MALYRERVAMKPEDVKIGSVLRHHSGRVYTVVAITNIAHRDPARESEAVLLGANGNWWSRPLSTFDGKFTVLFDGNNLA